MDKLSRGKAATMLAMSMAMVWAQEGRPPSPIREGPKQESAALRKRRRSRKAKNRALRSLEGRIGEGENGYEVQRMRWIC